MTESYPGGKSGAGVYQAIINELPPHDVFVSLFLGRCGVLRRIRPAARTIGVELDEAVLARHWTATPNSAPSADDAKSRDRRSTTVEIAASTSPRKCAPLQTAGVELYHADGIEWLRHASGFYRFPRAQVAPRNSALLEPGQTCLVYCDPPYLRETRRDPGKRLYRHEWDESDHVRFLETARFAAKVPGFAVAISHYDCPLYRAQLVSWRRVSFRAQTRGGPATETLWLSFRRPAVLHDPRYVGADKREREKWRRWSANLRRRIQRMTPRHRQAFLETVREAVE